MLVILRRVHQSVSSLPPLQPVSQPFAAQLWTCQPLRALTLAPLTFVLAAPSPEESPGCPNT